MIELQLRDPEINDAFVIFCDLSEDGFNLKNNLHSYTQSVKNAIIAGETCTLVKVEDGQETVLGLFSVLPLDIEKGFLVSFLTNNSKRYLLAATNLLKLILKTTAYTHNYRIIESDVCADYPKYIDWAKMYGFKITGFVAYPEISDKSFVRMSYDI